MCSGDVMFQKMVQSSMWTKASDILEKDGNGDEDEAPGNGDEAPDNGDEAPGEMLEEDAQVELNVAGFVDEDSGDLFCFCLGFWLLMPSSLFMFRIWLFNAKDTMIMLLFQILWLMLYEFVLLFQIFGFLMTKIWFIPCYNQNMFILAK